MLAGLLCQAKLTAGYFAAYLQLFGAEQQEQISLNSENAIPDTLLSFIDIIDAVQMDAEGLHTLCQVLC